MATGAIDFMNEDNLETQVYVTANYRIFRGRGCPVMDERHGPQERGGAHGHSTDTVMRKRVALTAAMVSFKSH